MVYTFSNLNDKDLEELTRDLLSKHFDLRFQSFKMGRDSGIDLRFSSNNEANKIIVQVKHFIGSGLPQLKRTLKNDELKKITTLNPERYILVTSLSLNPADKEDLRRLLFPYILNTNDIFGKDDLNGLLIQYPEIEEANFKLWLSGTTVLKRILKNATKGRSEFAETKIKEKIKLFAPNKTHDKAVSVLNEKNFILITGAPGIGKSMLANMLTYQLLAKDFNLVVITDIRDAEDEFLSNKKTVFYFDDFLGSVTLDLSSSRNADAAMITFIERVKADKTKRLILTCRTGILIQAKEESERISNSKIELSEHEIKMEDYTDFDKANILYNHIYQSSLPENLKRVFFENGFYWDIINHQNYNPRVIEFFTDKERIQLNNSFSKQVMDFLDNPEKIWEKSYTKQLSDEGRFFLSALFSLETRYRITNTRVKAAFEGRIGFEIKNNNYHRRGNVFDKALKELTGSFITVTHRVKDIDTQTEYAFLNPSIEDFLFYYFSNKNLDEYFNVLKSAAYLEQYRNRITTKRNPDAKLLLFEGENYLQLLKIIKTGIATAKQDGHAKKLEEIVVLIRLFKWSDISGIVVDALNNFIREFDLLSWFDYEFLTEILGYICRNNLQDKFTCSFENLILLLAGNISDYYQIDALSTLISTHSFYTDLIRSAYEMQTEFYYAFKQKIDMAWNKQFNNFILKTYNITEITDRSKLESLVQKRTSESIAINEMMGLNPSPILSKYIFDYEKTLGDNITNKKTNKELIEKFEAEQVKINDPAKINRLFNNPDDEDSRKLPF